MSEQESYNLLGLASLLYVKIDERKELSSVSDNIIVYRFEIYNQENMNLLE